MGPKYPTYTTQPYSGNLLTMQEAGPPDLRYSSGTAPYYQNKLDRAHGRSLAGDDSQDEPSQPATAARELDHYALMDDVQGNGIFDAPGSAPNINPDAGVFATRYSLPGYSARERPFSSTEIVDVTTGRPVRVVPSGAVAMDAAAEVAFLEQGAFAPPEPVLLAEQTEPLPARSITNVYQDPEPIGETTTPSQNWSGLKLVFAVSALGLAIGGIAALAFPKKRKS